MPYEKYRLSGANKEVKAKTRFGYIERTEKLKKIISMIKENQAIVQGQDKTHRNSNHFGYKRTAVKLTYDDLCGIFVKAKKPGLSELFFICVN